jgi:hypothetical protein
MPTLCGNAAVCAREAHAAPVKQMLAASRKVLRRGTESRLLKRARDAPSDQCAAGFILASAGYWRAMPTCRGDSLGLQKLEFQFSVYLCRRASAIGPSITVLYRRADLRRWVLVCCSLASAFCALVRIGEQLLWVATRPTACQPSLPEAVIDTEPSAPRSFPSRPHAMTSCSHQRAQAVEYHAPTALR